jgi:hypothetical protein
MLSNFWSLLHECHNRKQLMIFSKNFIQMTSIRLCQALDNEKKHYLKIMSLTIDFEIFKKSIKECCFEFRIYKRRLKF